MSEISNVNLTDFLLREFCQRKIIVVGDIVADQFLHGTISRVSREAPVFILRHDETETIPGGAANAAMNVASLGARALLVGVVGKDSNGEKLLAKLKGARVDCRNVVESADWQTTTKVRVLAAQYNAPRQQVIRIDYENESTLPNELIEKVKQNFAQASAEAEAIIISDYNYGVANVEIAAFAKKIALEKQIPLLVDSRFHLYEFQGATTATPNQDEVLQLLGKNSVNGDNFEQSCIELRQKLALDALLVTRGNQGMLLIERDKPPFQIDAIGAKEPVDVTGAGDTVIATYALGLASSLDFQTAASLANHAGGIVVTKRGTATVSIKELLRSIKR